MAGYWPQSRSQIHDQNGKPFIGAKATFYAGGTTTPIVVYRDSALAVPHTNPVSTDGNGTFPGVYFDDDPPSFYRVRVTTKGGVLLYDDDGIPVIGPSTGGGGPGPAPVDPDAIMKTGDMLIRYGAELRTGFVRHNGRTIGTATSGASERANSDCQPLYEYLWNLDPNLVIGGGRGGSAAADWAANKPLTLPDPRGSAIVISDINGNVPAGVLPEANIIGWKGGVREVTLTIAQMAPHDHPLTQVPHRHNWGNTARAFSVAAPGSSGGFLQGGTAPGELFTTETTIDLTMGSRGGGAAHTNVQPSAAYTIYQRL